MKKLKNIQSISICINYTETDTIQATIIVLISPWSSLGEREQIVPLCIYIYILIKRRACHCFCSTAFAAAGAERTKGPIHPSDRVWRAALLVKWHQIEVVCYSSLRIKRAPLTRLSFFLWSPRRARKRYKHARTYRRCHSRAVCIDLMRLPTPPTCILCKQSIKSSSNRRLISFDSALKRPLRDTAKRRAIMWRERTHLLILVWSSKTTDWINNAVNFIASQQNYKFDVRYRKN